MHNRVTTISQSKTSFAENGNGSEMCGQRFFRTLNQNGRDYLRAKTVHWLFEMQAEATPTDVAVEWYDTQVSFEALNARANQLAHHLMSRGVSPRSLVGICLERTPDMVIAILAVLKTGAAYVPMDPSYPSERLAFMLKDAQVAALITESGLSTKLVQHEVAQVCLDSHRDLIEACGEGNPNVEMAATDLAYVIYTSGSTGKPKGAKITHRGLVNYLAWAVDAYQVASGCGSPVHSSISFDLTITSLFTPLMAGKTAFLLPNGVESLAQALLKRNNYSLIKITPAHLRVLSEILPPAEVAGCTRMLVIGGETLHFENLSFWRTNAPSTRIVNEYGPTETVVGCCVYEVNHEDATSGRVPIGRPIANTQLHLLNERCEPVVPGTAGELYIGGDGVADGYLNRDDLTRERFIADPFSDDPEGRLYRSGDQCILLEDGNLEFLGRLDGQVKIKGFRIETEEIEAALSELPCVSQHAVVAVDEGKTDKRLTAFVVRKFENVDAKEIKDFLKSKLPDYMVPSSVVFVESLPLTINGKIDRDALLRQGSGEVAENFVAASNPIERTLAMIWSDVFKLQRVGINDNFFDLGGDSILGSLILARAAQVGLKLSPRQLFAHQTIAALSRAVSD